MARSRTTRAFAVLALFLAQAVLGASSGVLGGSRAYARGAAGLMASGASATHMTRLAAGTGSGEANAPARAPGHCDHGSLPPGSQHGPMPPPCSSCPGMPAGPMGGCPAMAGCTASPASPSSIAPVAPATVTLTDVPPAATAPAAHDFIPDPPPPRA